MSQVSRLLGDTQPQSQRESSPRENEPQWVRDADGRLQRRCFDFAKMTPAQLDAKKHECPEGIEKFILHRCVRTLLLALWSCAILGNE